MKVFGEIDRSDVISTIVVLALFVGIPLILTNWSSLKSFIATTPKAKCEARLGVLDEDIYCKEDGNKASHLTDQGKICTDWRNNHEGGKCQKHKYASKEFCLADKSNVDRPIDAPDGLTVQCLDDGSWKFSVTDMSPDVIKTTCIDLTTHDYNWENDYLCRNPDGSEFYTSQENAQNYQ
jgi:hypothetical protein